MLGTARTKIELNCPSYGQAGVAMVVSGSGGKTASVVHGFIVRMAADNSIQIVRSTCLTTLYEAK
jgi:hypothetical protein